MAVLYIAEAAYLETDAAGSPMMGMKMPPKAKQSITFSASTPSAAFAPGTRFIRLWSDTDCYVEFGASPTATATSMPLAAKAAEYFAVQSGHKVAAVT